MTTPTTSRRVVAVSLALAVALGACGTQRQTTEAQDAQPKVVAAKARADAVQLKELRDRYPTAGTEVPPADLHRADAAATATSGPRTEPTSTHRYVK